MNAEGARCGLERHGGDRRGRHHYQRLPSGDRLMGAGDVTAGFAAIDGLELYYETRGAGRPLVLIHGALMTIGLMKDYPSRLAADRQVIAVELQGHGHTADIDRPEADLFGYSIGAGVALQVAIRHPARVRRVVAASATYRTDGLHSEITAAGGGDDAG